MTDEDLDQLKPLRDFARPDPKYTRDPGRGDPRCPWTYRALWTFSHEVPVDGKPALQTVRVGKLISTTLRWMREFTVARVVQPHAPVRAKRSPKTAASSSTTANESAA